jgi:prevent-host-death family protein
MVNLARSIALSLAKSGLSEVVRTVRKTGEPVVITVDGEPAAQIVPMVGQPRQLAAPEVAAVRVLMEALHRIPRVAGAFDACALVGEGRR